jgi:hypothetical protein
LGRLRWLGGGGGSRVLPRLTTPRPRPPRLRRLRALCEAALASELAALGSEDGGDPEEAAELAPALLAVADEQGLAQLRRAALSYCLEHYEQVGAGRGGGL